MDRALAGIALLLPPVRAVAAYNCAVIVVLCAVLAGLRYKDATPVGISPAPAHKTPVFLSTQIEKDQVSRIVVDAGNPLTGKLRGVVDVVFSSDAGHVFHFQMEDPFVERLSTESDEWSVAERTYAPLISSLRSGTGFAQSPHSAELWGINVSRFGSGGREAVQSCFVEMVGHAWLIIGLPFLCLCAARRMVQTFSSDFVQFLRFGRASCLFAESIRLASLLVILLLTMCPFILSGAIAIAQHRFDAVQVGAMIARCGDATLGVLLALYLLSAGGTPLAGATALAMMSVFVWTGLSQLIARVSIGGEALAIETFMPPGLPYHLGVDELRFPTGIGYAAVIATIRSLATLEINVTQLGRWYRDSETKVRQ
jgi:hypothetical protein